MTQHDTLNPLSQFDFHQVLAATPGISLVMFGSRDCGTCRHLKRVFSELAGQRVAGLSLFEVDVQQDTALAREFDVFHLPSMFLFRDGEFHCELHSPAQPEELVRRIEQALIQPAEEAP
jgi:thioredoxin-like negative regulator of GroEL